MGRTGAVAVRFRLAELPAKPLSSAARCEPQCVISTITSGTSELLVRFLRFAAMPKPQLYSRNR
jgi:hypothetical protein